MEITADTHIVRYTAKNKKEVFTWTHLEAWLVANCSGEMFTLPGLGTDQVDIMFDNESDALLFLLSWGGEHLRPYKDKSNNIGWAW